MRKLKLKEIVIVTSLSVILTGCSAQKVEQPNNFPNNDVVINQTISKNEYSSVFEDTYGSSFEDTYETEELTYFENAKDELRKLSANEDYQKIKSKGKEYFVTGIDFIFFDKPINGMYFKDLSTEMKIYTIEEMNKIDRAIMEYHPYYKEEISSKYNIAAGFLSEQYLNVLEDIKEYLGEDNVNAIEDIKDKVTDSAKDVVDDAKTYIIDYYNTWKNK